MSGETDGVNDGIIACLAPWHQQIRDEFIAEAKDVTGYTATTKTYLLGDEVELLAGQSWGAVAVLTAFEHAVMQNLMESFASEPWQRSAFKPVEFQVVVADPFASRASRLALGPERPSTVGVASAPETTPQGFLPSESLVQFWTRGLRDHVGEYAAQRTREEQTLLNQPINVYQVAFGKRIARLMSVVGHRHRNGIANYGVIASEGHFSVPIQHHVLDRIQIRPDESTEFFAQLLSEFRRHLETGGAIAGTWGRLAIRRNTIELIPSAGADRERGPWEMATIVE